MNAKTATGDPMSHRHANASHTKAKTTPASTCPRVIVGAASSPRPGAQAKKAWLAVLWLVLSCWSVDAVASTPQTGPIPWPKDTASYRIHARLNHAKRRIDGYLRLIWRNPSKQPVRQLRLHLYMNAFRNEKSTFLQDLRKLGRFGAFGYRVPAGRWGWCKILKLQLKDQTDLAKKARFISPDDGNRDDRTMLEVPLPKPVPPDGKIELLIKFQTKLPWGMFRVGYRKDYYFVGQWYPKVAVYEPKGVRGAKRPRWNSHQFHATSEFYADFGHYQVDITVPKRFVVGATGERKQVTEDQKAGTKTYRYEQSHVHDFAWTASPHHRRYEVTFDPAKDVSQAERQRWAKRLKLPPKSLKLRKVKMVFMMQPEHMHLFQRHVAGLRAVLRTYGLWLGAYPYSTITLVDPPYEGAVRAFSGMEYATLFTAGTRRYIAANNRNLEWLITHEFGHMYFQGMLASNEFEEPWLDEGVNTYSNTKLMRWLYPKAEPSPHALHLPWDFLASIRMNHDQLPRLAYLTLKNTQDPVAQPAWKYQSGASYGQQAYFKAALVLQNLEHIIGEDTMLRAMRDYYQKWRFRHPHGADFTSHMQRYTKRDLKPFFDQFLTGTKVLDYAVGRISSRRIWRERGIYKPLLPGRIKHKKRRKRRKQALNRRAKSKTQPKTALLRAAPRTAQQRVATGPSTRPATQKTQKSPPPVAKGAQADAVKNPAKQPAHINATTRRRPPQRKTALKRQLVKLIQVHRSRRKRNGKTHRKKAKKKRKKRRDRYRSQVVIQRRGSAIWPVEVKMVFADQSAITRHWDGKGRWKRFVVETPSRLAYVKIDPQDKLTLDVDMTNNSRVMKKSKRASMGWWMRLISWLQHIMLSLALLL